MHTIKNAIQTPTEIYVYNTLVLHVKKLLQQYMSARARARARVPQRGQD